jgi:hypothetical protein
LDKPIENCIIPMKDESRKSVLISYNTQIHGCLGRLITLQAHHRRIKYVYTGQGKLIVVQPRHTVRVHKKYKQV